MNAERPIMEQLPQMKMPDTQSAQAAASDAMNTVSSSIANVQGSINNTLNEFSSKSAVDASQEFLNSNSIIAKFVFIILVLIVFMFLVNLGVTLMGYFMQPSLSPFLINGMINGNNGIIITQDPKNVNSVTVTRSNNQATGIEFTWSTWILITSVNGTTGYQNIFNKGDTNYTGSGGISVVNGPGLYLKKADTASNNENVLHVVMDTVDPANPMTMDISGVPMNKWFHLALRMENKVMDAYINGTVFSRSLLQAVPKQNYYNVNVGQNGGFAGNISNLRYYNYALPAYQLASIVATGANTSTSSLALQNASTAPAVLSNQWYSQWYK